MKDTSKDSGLKGIRLNYKMTVFVLCLGISTLIWFLIKLSDTYTTEISFPVKFENPPKGKILTNEVDSLISVKIQDKGYTIAALKYLPRKKPFVIDLSKLKLHRKGRNYESRINTIALTQNLEDYYGFEGEIFYIYPDTMYFLFEGQASSKVRIVPDVSFEFRKQHFLYDSIRTEPAEVSINGLSSEIDTITFIKTEHIEFKNLDDSVNILVKLVKPKIAGDFSTDPEQVRLIIPVEKFTESEINVPITQRNNTSNLRLKLFPETVKITYLVALNDYKKVDADMFSCFVYVSEAKENSGKKLHVTAGTYPKFIKIIRIQPSEVDYLILK